MSETDVLIKQLTDVLRTARELSSDLTVVGRLLEIDGAAALTKSRVITELVLHRLCVEAGVLVPRRPTIYSLLDALSVAKALPEPAKRLVQTVSLYANAAAHHRGTTPTMSDVAAGVAAMLSLVDWAAEQGLVDSAMTAQALPIQRGDRVRHLDNPMGADPLVRQDYTTKLNTWVTRNPMERGLSGVPMEC